MTANEFLSESGYKKICTCLHRDQRTFCQEDDCEILPDKEEILEHLKDLKHQTKVVKEAMRYIERTPLHVIDGTGRRFCDCQKRHNAPLWQASPELKHNREVDYFSAQTIPMPSDAQIKALVALFNDASFEQRKEVEEIVPDFRRKITKIIGVLIKK